MVVTGNVDVVKVINKVQ